MYTCEGLKKYRVMMKKAVDYYEDIPVDDLEISLSSGNRKIGHVLNVSLPPIFTCGNCAECFKYCYDIKACLQYKNVTYARARNYSILKRDFNGYFEQIQDCMKRRRKNKYFRFHVAGDITTIKYLDNMIKTAKMFPDWVIWTYTKEYDLVNNYVSRNGGTRKKAIPQNLTIMFSEWKGLKMDNPYNFPVFRCVFRGIEKPPKGWHKCSGNCDDCKKNKTGCVVGKNSWTYDH